jgi:hypothetical protein
MSRIAALTNPFGLIGVFRKQPSALLPAPGSRSLRYGIRPNQRSLSRSATSVNWRELVGAQTWVVRVLAVVNVAVLLLYLVGVNQYAAKGYEMKSIQNRVASLETEQHKLLLKISEISAIGQLEKDLTMLGYVPVTKVQFVQGQQYSQR